MTLKRPWKEFQKRRGGGEMFRFANIFLSLLSFWGHLILTGIKCWPENDVAERDLSCLKSSLLFLLRVDCRRKRLPSPERQGRGRGGGAFPAENRRSGWKTPLTEKVNVGRSVASARCQHSRLPSVSSARRQTPQSESGPNVQRI